jgi:translation initiation factor IF-2
MPLANVKFPDVNWKAEKRGRNATGAEVAEVDGFKLHVAPQATEGDKKPTDFDWTVMGEKHSDQGTAKTMNGARIRAVEILNRLRRLEDKQRRDAEAEAKAKAKAEAQEKAEAEAQEEEKVAQELADSEQAAA